MKSEHSYSRLGLASVAILAAAASVAIAVWLYVQPETGVAGSPGALLTIIGSVAVLLFCMALWWARGSRGISIVIGIALVLAAILTAIAGWFLLAPAISVAMVVVLIGAAGLMLTRKPGVPA